MTDTQPADFELHSRDLQPHRRVGKPDKRAQPGPSSAGIIEKNKPPPDGTDQDFYGGSVESRTLVL